MSILHRTGILSLVVLTGLVLAGGSIALGANYHTGSDLTCSDCHVMHASYNGTSYNAGSGFDDLLKGTATSMCLVCHDGTDTTAPDVVATGTAAAPNDTLSVAYASAWKSSGGYFQSDAITVVNDAAHDLYAASALTATQGTWTSGSSGMVCTDCHSAHGTANYRNLLLQPGTAGSDIDVTVDADVYLDATKTTLAQKYDHDTIGYNAPNDVKEWCIGCHTSIASDSSSPWAKHPQDVEVSTLDDSGSHWDTGTGVGFGDTTVGGGSAGIPRVRYAEGGSTFAETTTKGDTNEVFCLSCHKPHGSKYDSALLWPHYTDDNVDQTSGCDQCHAKGG